MLGVMPLPAIKPEGQALVRPALLDCQQAGGTAPQAPLVQITASTLAQPHLSSAGSNALRQCSVTDEMLNALEGDYLALCEAAAACGMPTGAGAPPPTRTNGAAGPSTADDGSPNSKRRNRGQRLEAIIKAEGEHGSSSEEDEGAEERDGDQESPRWNDWREGDSMSPHKRARTGADTNGNDAGGAHSGGAHSGGSHDGDAGAGGNRDAPEGDRARVRREKNRVAARKCRAKKLAFMNDLQTTLRDLMRKNEEYKMQVITWHKMFSREVRMREAMKRIIAATWQSGLLPGAKNISAHDLIIGLESGSLDVNELLQSLGVPPMTNGAGPMTHMNGTSNIAMPGMNGAGPIPVSPTAASAGNGGGMASNGGLMTAGLQSSLAPPAVLPMAGADPSPSHTTFMPHVAPLAAPMPPQQQQLPAAASMAMQPPAAVTAAHAPPRQPTVAELAMQSVLNGGFQWPEVLATVGPSAALPPPGIMSAVGVCGGEQ